MPITKDVSNVIQYTKRANTWDESNTGVYSAQDFAIADNIDPTKQIQFDASGIPANTKIVLTPPSASGTLLTAAGGAIPPLPNAGFTLVEHWISANAAGALNWAQASAGAGSGNSLAPTNLISGNHQGIAGCFTGTTTTGRSAFFLGAQNLLGAGVVTFESLVYVDVLSTVGDEFFYNVGIGDTTTGDMQNGVYFSYDRLNLGLNWQIKTAFLNSRTAVDSGIPVQAATWVKLKIVVAANGASAQYFINGTSVGTISTNMPSTSTGYVGPIMGIYKTAGTTGRQVYHDYVYYNELYTSPL